MKTRLTLLCTFFILILTASCKQESNSSEFEKSYNAWLKFKAESQNSYNYSVTTGSFTGFRTETIIYVQNGKVVKRSFKATTQHAGPPIVVQEEWTEEEAGLNIHQRGAATLTLEEVYAEVRNNWLKKRDKATTYFENKHNGMISLAGYEEDGCQDDCFRGIMIGFIAKIQY